MKKILHKIKEWKILLILVVAVILAVPIFHKNNDIYLDDGSQHLMRAYGTYKSLLQNGSGNVISDFANGFGYSWNLFYGPLSAYLIILFGVIFGSFNIGFKIVMFLIIVAAGACMYKLVCEMTENKDTAVLAGIIYMTSPYFFTDIYVRHAIRRMYGICICSTGVFGII